MDVLYEARKVFETEIEALRKTRDVLGADFESILSLIIGCKGKIVITGVGKSGHIASKIAATFSSLGTPAFFMHPAEAMHGDLGMISENDVVIAISYSGESDEIIKIIPNIKLIGAKLVAITGKGDSTLALAVDVCQVLPQFSEACYLGLAPTSSTTSVLCYGDALAVVASQVYGFGDGDFGKFHPSGLLGKRLILKVQDLMTCGKQNAIISEKSLLEEAIVELSQKALGIVSVINDDGEIVGVITDGDLRRQLEKKVSIYELHVKDVMCRTPMTISKEALAVEALNKLKENNISGMPVCDAGKVIGTIRLQDIISVGIV